MIENGTQRRELIDEIARYLAAVDLFRAAGCEPTWRPERPADPLLPATASVPLGAPSDVELH